jgi:glycosyltransferase involved in cell wall biosynthesis
MKIAFITAQSPSGSTNVGRILPLASAWGKAHEVHVIAHRGSYTVQAPSAKIHLAGLDPFVTSENGKQRLGGIRLIGRLAANTLQVIAAGRRIRPKIVIISKPLPENVLAAQFLRFLIPGLRVILDVDDFELTANVISSLNQRAAIQWSQRAGARLAESIVVATPFLKDHFAQLGQDSKNIIVIPTGVAAPPQFMSLSGSRKPLPASVATVVLYIGSVSVSSGHRVDLLPDILARIRDRLPGTTLVIAGSGDDVGTLQQEFERRELSDAVVWHGRFSAAEVGQLVDRAAVLIDPVDSSITNRAKSSFRAAVAASYGKAIVTSDVGIRPYLLPQALHKKFFAPVADPIGYADKISQLIQQPLTEAEEQSLVRHGGRFSWNILAQRYLTLLDL